MRPLTIFTHAVHDLKEPPIKRDVDSVLKTPIGGVSRADTAWQPEPMNDTNLKQMSDAERRARLAGFNGLADAIRKIEPFLTGSSPMATGLNVPAAATGVTSESGAGGDLTEPTNETKP